MTPDQLTEEYRRLTRNCYNVDYGDKQAVKRNNDSTKRMYQIVETINEEFGPSGILKLKSLLDVTEFHTDLWIATHLLEKVSLDIETERKALGIIAKVAAGNDVLALGYQHWMREWELKRRK